MSHGAGIEGRCRDTELIAEKPGRLLEAGRRPG